jgi:L-malate glycosyltransferase
VRTAGWDVDWIAYGPTEREAVARFDEVALEVGGRFVVARTLVDLIASAIRLRRLLRKLEPDLIQTHWFLGPMWIAALAGTRPIVATAWGSDVLLPFPGRRAARILTRLLSKRIDAVTSSSEHLERGLLEAGLPAEQLHRVVHGIDAEQFSPIPRNEVLLRELGVDPAVPVVLSPRGITPVYAPETVLRAFSELVARRPATLLLRVPDGQREEWDRLRADLQSNVLQHVVTFEGVTRELFPQLLASSDVVLSVARSDGASITVMEALFCERPLIVSDIPQNREWVIDEGFGAIIDVDDAAALAEAIEAVLADPAAAATKARLAGDHARAIGDQDVALGAVVQLYERILQQTGSS